MARSYAGGARAMIKGSVGSETYSVGKDGRGKKQQIVRSKPVEVANPRTQAQAAQRLKAKPIQFARNLMVGYIDHSFRGVAVGNDSVYHFLRINMSQMDVPYQVKGDINNELGGYQISDGNLAIIRPELVIGTNRVSKSYGHTLAAESAVLIPVSPDIMTGGGYKDFCADVLKNNPTLQAGDEITVFTFYNVSGASGHSVDVRAVRLIIDPEFNEDVPESFKPVQIGSDGAETVLDCDILYAIQKYNPDLELVYKSRFLSGTGVNLAALILQNVLGIENPVDIDGVIQPIVGFGGYNSRYGSPYDAVALLDTNPFADGAAIGGTIVVSRLINGSWDFSLSEIGLQVDYLNEVNSGKRLAEALKSFMAEEGSESASNALFLRLSDGTVTQVGSTSIDFEANVRDASGKVVGAATALTAIGLQSASDGSRFLYVDENGVLLQYANGPKITFAYTPDGSEDEVTIDVKAAHVVQYSGRVIQFVTSDAVLA